MEIVFKVILLMVKSMDKASSSFLMEIKLKVLIKMEEGMDNLKSGLLA